MSPGAKMVLRKLQENQQRGLTWDDFHKGFRLSARIYEIRGAGYSITTFNETIRGGKCDGLRKARYVINPKHYRNMKQK